MTYQMLYVGCYTSEAKEVANELRYLNGFQTAADDGDVERVNEIDIKAMGGDL
jgi:hypothetical protein